MKGYQFIVSGNWAHFKKPETNNNPLSHDLLTKTALIGMIGAVLGIEREDMRLEFPKLSEDLLYGIRLLSPVKKISCGFTSRKANNPTKPGVPNYFEFLKNPRFLVSLALKSPRSESEFGKFGDAIQNEEAVYPPVLGWHNCPADLEWQSEGEFAEIEDGTFETKGFVVAGDHPFQNMNSKFRMGFDRLPTFQEDFWNLPDRYKHVVYPDYPHSITASGKHYDYTSINAEKIEKWVLI